MSKKYLWSALTLLALVASACGPAGAPSAPTQDVDAIVQATFQALTAQAPAEAVPVNTAVATPTAPEISSETGTITGKLTYPADAIPAMRVAAFKVSTGEVSFMDTTAGQTSYSFELPVGTYRVVAYSIGSAGFPSGVAGGYTQAVLCGFSGGCNDHSLVDINVTAGATVSDINPGDFFQPGGTYPPMPGVQASAGADSNPGYGSVSGSLSYPSSALPGMVVVAFTANSSFYFYVITNQGQSTYRIDDLPAGTYHVVAYSQAGGNYASGLAGGYTAAVPCGLQASCTDHSLLDVTVTAGQVTPDINPGDWYAPAGAFPVNPVP